MKLPQTKTLVTSLMLGVFTLFSSTGVWADNSAASDPIAAISNNNSNNNAATTNNSNANDNSSSENDATNSNNTSANVGSNSGSNNSNNSPSPQSKQSQDAIGNMLLQSVSLMGIAYKWGGNTPDTGMDCSGFVRYVFNKSLGINLPRTAAEMARVGKRVSIDQLQPGDLIFFNTRRGSNTHIGIYLGGNKFIQSPRTGESIQITDLSGYWVQHFNGAKRVVQEDQNSNGDTTVENFQNIRDQALPVASYRGGKRGRHTRNSVHGSRQKAKSSRNAHSSAKSKNRSATKAKVVSSAKSKKKKAH